MLCAMAKRFATDAGFDVGNQALQLHGGYGYLSEYPLERLRARPRVHQILEGTNEIMRLIVVAQAARGRRDDNDCSSCAHQGRPDRAAASALGVVRARTAEGAQCRRRCEMFHDVDSCSMRSRPIPLVGVILLEAAGEQAFCAGGDLRPLCKAPRSERNDSARFFRARNTSSTT